MEIIDAQIHLWKSPSGPPHHTRCPYTMERALTEMDEAGVTAAVNCPAIWDPDANAYAERAARAHPDRFATLAWIPLTSTPEPAAAHAALDAEGVLGLRFVLATPELLRAAADGSLDWLWDVAAERAAPVALALPPDAMDLVGRLADQHSGVRFLVDHLGVSPFDRLPEASRHLPALLALAEYDNVAVKASAIPSMATDEWPYASTHALLRGVFDAFGPSRMFWGTDITRMSIPWSLCVRMFTECLPWLRGRDLELVMGQGVIDWLDWSYLRTR